MQYKTPPRFLTKDQLVKLFCLDKMRFLYVCRYPTYFSCDRSDNCQKIQAYPMELHVSKIKYSYDLKNAKNIYL